MTADLALRWMTLFRHLYYGHLITQSYVDVQVSAEDAAHFRVNEWKYNILMLPVAVDVVAVEMKIICIMLNISD